MSRKQLDLQVLAENGLRRGFSTGTCAAACAKAASLALLGCRSIPQVHVALPGGQYYANVAISRLMKEEGERWRAEVIKDAGDDPDVTHGATIFALCRANDGAAHRLLAGEGIGIVTRNGLRVPIGQPAINPVPRQMILDAVNESFEEVDASWRAMDIHIGCVNGEVLAQKTFNPRLGIEGGISILGTTGIVEPMSLAAWQASVEVYIRVAMAAGDSLALLPGNIGNRFARSQGLRLEQIVMISNFLGFALDTVERVAGEQGRGLEKLWVLGHPGKLAKALGAHWDTHSKNSPMALADLAEFGKRLQMPLCAEVANANTVEDAISILRQRPQISNEFWFLVERELERLFAERVSRVKKLNVRLFDMSGVELTNGEIG